MNLIEPLTLFLGVLLYLAAVFLKPFVLIVRDTFVWLWIDKRLFNRQVIEDVVRLARENELWITRRFVDTLFMHPDPDGSYVYRFDGEDEEVEPIVLSAAERKDLFEKSKSALNWRDNAAINIEKKSNQLDSIVKHYGQEKQNPIDKKFAELKEAYKSDATGICYDHIKSVEYIVSEIKPEGREFRVSRQMSRDYHRSKSSIGP